MQIIQTLTNNNDTPLALTIGNFDGVHIGHQAILNKVVALAKQEALVPTAMTFSPHAKIFFGRGHDFLINSESEKAALIAEHGIEYLYQVPFDTEFSSLSAEEFLTQLVHRLRVKYLLVGDDFRFGNRGKGDFDLLHQYCSKYNVSVENTPTVTYEGERVSSSRIRDTIRMNNFNLAKQLMGRALTYEGIIEKGQQIGRTIDFPTANIHLPESRLLPSGVFAVYLSIAGESNFYQGMCNIGFRPTITTEAMRKIEVNIFDFSGDLYGRKLRVYPVAKIRNEQKFKGITELMMQLQEDKRAALNILNASETRF